MAIVAKPKWVPVTQWVALEGNWSIADSIVHYKGRSISNGPGLAVCDERFQDGLVRSLVRLEENQNGVMKGITAGIVLGYNAGSGGYVVVGLGAFDFAYGILEFVPGFGWANRKTLGDMQNLRFNQDYQLEVTQRGQRITLEIDGVRVLEHVMPSPLPGNQLGLFTMSDSAVRFQEYEVQRRAPTAFVAMQFGDPYDALYRRVIRPKAKAMGFEIERIDEVKQPGIIFQDIQERIQDATVVIAEITAPNQNVFYEVGYAHALNKPTILLAQRGKELPFDIRSYRVIFYDDTIGGKPLVEKMLRDHLQAILHEM
jgi:hypothetical protein